MGKLTRSAGRLLGAGALMLAGVGVLLVSGAGIANAQPAGTSPSTNSNTSACNKIFAAFDSFDAMLSKHPGTVKSDAAIATAEFTLAASTASPAVKSAVDAFLSDLKADAASGTVNRPKLVADGDAIVAACAAVPNGAPATGGGSTAGVQDPALFGVGGAGVLAGIGVVGLGLARRNRPQRGPGHG
jgi:hypothetical protein